MLTMARLAALWSVVLWTPALAESQLTPDQATEVTKAVKQCVATVHTAAKCLGLETCPQGSEFFKNFDAFYNSASGRVENNVSLQGERKALFLFNKCMSEKGHPLG
jgi:hypothetical protein